MALIEFVYLLSGQNDPWIVKYNKQLAEYLDESVVSGEKFFNAQYGNRMLYAFGYDQLMDVIETLQKDPDSRQAGIVYRHPYRDAFIKNTKDRACNIASMFIIRGRQLHITQLVRSQDFIWGLPYNFMQFGFLTQYIAEQLGIPVGSYSEMVQSLHVYEPHYEHLHQIQKHGFETKSKKLVVPEIGKVSIEGLVEYIKNLEQLVEAGHFESDLAPGPSNYDTSPFWSNAAVIIHAYLIKKNGGTHEEVIEQLKYCRNDLFRVMATRYFCHYYKRFADVQMNHDVELFKLAWGLD